MKEYIVERVMEIAYYILQTGDTVRGAAKKFAVSKSTVHKDVTERLKEIDKSLFKDVRKVEDANLAQRHIRGGLATRQKYLRKNAKSVEKPIKK
ncbi:MAG: sporulation transcriptional regulator SpoIIID [Clostridia bacterium]